MKTPIRLNKEICEEHLDVLHIANKQWFYGYHWSLQDQIRLEEALEFFENIRRQQLKKIVEERS